LQRTSLPVVARRLNCFDVDDDVTQTFVERWLQINLRLGNLVLLIRHIDDLRRDQSPDRRHRPSATIVVLPRVAHESRVLAPVRGSDGVKANLQLLVVDAEDRKLRLAVWIEHSQAFAGHGQIGKCVADLESQRLVFAERLPVYVADRGVERDGVDRATFRRAFNVCPIAVIIYFHSRQFWRDANLRFVEGLNVE
jgi:hypothetical protein